MRSFLLILILTLTLCAQKSVSKSATISKSLYPDSSAYELKQIVLKKAKLEAAKEMFGEFLLSQTVMRNGQIIDDIVRQSHGGVIHIKGEPEFSETKTNIRVNIEAYATDEDIKNVSPHEIIIEEFIYSNPSLALKDIKSSARDAFILEAISRKKPSVKTITQARKLALEVIIKSESFDIKTLDYTISGTIVYIPAFLRHSDSIKDIEPSNYSSVKKVIIKEKKDFYGKWTGFLMSKNGYTSSVAVNISSFTKATIDYKSLKCGGDLIVQEKNTKRVIFKEVIIYGEENCKQNSTIILQKVTPKSLQFTQKNENEKLFLGRIYLVE